MANDRNWGGKRAGAGRKPGSRTSKKVPHRKRPTSSEDPKRGAITFRKDVDLAVAMKIVREVCDWMETEHDENLAARKAPLAPLYSPRLRGRTLRFEVFASVACMSESVQRFGTRVARRINKAMKRSGKVFEDRYRLLSKPYVPPPPPTLGERIKERLSELAYAVVFIGAEGAGATFSRRRSFR